jgi:hypothetical protein
MTKKADLLAAMEDDLKQFWTAFKGGLRSVPGTVVNRVGRLAGVTPDSASSRPAPVEERTNPALPPAPEEPRRP